MERFEKVDDYTVNVIKEEGTVVTLSQLLENESRLLKQKEQTEKALKKLRILIKETKKLGIKEIEKDLNPKK